jgi:phage recombination protein Bet
MAVQNSIVKKPDSAGMVEYESGGQTVKLSPAMIRKYLVSGGGNVSDQEVMMFLSLCKFQHLNPFLHEAYLIKYGNSPATMVTGKDVFIKRARRNADYRGKETGIIVIDNAGNVVERAGAFYLTGEQIVGGWAKVYINGFDKPEYAAVSFNEYAGRKSNGELNNQWATKPATMIQKVALVHALREAFPEDFNGMTAPEEIPAANDLLEAAATEQTFTVQEAPEAIPEESAPPMDVQTALFG